MAAPGGELGEHLRPGRRSPLLEDRDDGPAHRPRELEVAALGDQPVEVPAVARPGQRVQPRKVVHVEEVDGPPHGPGAHEAGRVDGGAVEANDPGAQRETRRAHVLRLDTDHATGRGPDVGGLRSGGEGLSSQPKSTEALRVGHGAHRGDVRHHRSRRTNPRSARPPTTASHAARNGTIHVPRLRDEPKGPSWRIVLVKPEAPVVRAWSPPW